MTENAKILFTTMFSEMYRFLISITIPGTTLSGFEFLFGILLFKIVLNIFKLFLDMGASSLSDIKFKSNKSNITLHSSNNSPRIATKKGK